MVGFVGLRAGDWTRALKSDWEEASSEGCSSLVVIAALERGAGGVGAFGEEEKLERGGEMGRVACNWA
jgi:hypothetical protein